MRSNVVALAAALALAAGALLAASPAVAQVPGIELRVNPRIGVYFPLTDLGQAGQTADSIASMEAGLALGLGVTLELPILPFDIRANLDYATGASVSREGGVDTDAGKATVMAVVGDLVFRPLPRLIVLQPYLFAGGGVKQYDFTDAENFRNASDPTIHLGGGLDFTLGPIALNAELGDYLSWYEIRDGADSKMQHDLFVTVGFSIGML